jgi:hypothetical protein
MSMRLAGERMRRVIGIASTGFPIYAISGSEGDETGGDGETKTEEKEKEGSAGGAGETTPPAPVTVTLEEYETIKRRMEAADSEKGKLAKQLREIEDKDKSEVDKLKRDFEEAQAELKKAREEALAAKLSSEILKFPGFVWHDPEAVLRLVDMEMISVDEAGAVKGVKDALNKLAKDKPYLLKGKQGKDENKPGGAGTNGASGHNPAGGGDTADKNKRRDELRAKYKIR